MMRRRREEPAKRAAAASDLEDLLVDAVVDGALRYADIAPDGRELDADDRGRALAQLEAGALAIIEATRQRDLIASATTMPAAQTLALIRIMQQGLVLALSDDPQRRARAVDAVTVASYGLEVRDAWREHLDAERARVAAKGAPRGR
jgi:hypothetical protein